jgi:hypothetical protein
MNDDDNTNMTSVYSYVSTDDTITITGDSDPANSIFPWSGMGAGGAAYSKKTLNSVFDDIDIFGEPTQKKESTVYDLDKDPLAVILHFKKNKIFPSCEKDFVNCQPLPEEFERANEIRSYYIDKIATQKLSGTYRDTDFKKDLSKALKLSAKNVFEEDLIRILYRLDDFYNEDIALAAVVEKSRPNVAEGAKVFRLDNEALTFLDKVTVIRRGHSVNKYFFTDSANQLVCIDAMKSNSLSAFVELAINHLPRISVTGRFSKSLIWDHNFPYITVVPEKVNG